MVKHVATDILEQDLFKTLRTYFDENEVVGEEGTGSIWGCIILTNLQFGDIIYLSKKRHFLGSKETKENVNIYCRTFVFFCSVCL